MKLNKFQAQQQTQWNSNDSIEMIIKLLLITFKLFNVAWTNDAGKAHIAYMDFNT